MYKIKFSIHNLNKHVFLGFSFFIFSLITSVFWGLTYAEDLSSSLTLNIPNSPTGLTYKVSSSSVDLTWVDNAINEDKFNISRRLSSGQNSTSDSSSWVSIALIAFSNITTYTDKTATPGFYYDYSVEACLSGAGCSSSSIVERVFVPSINLNGDGTNTTTCTGIELKLNDNKTTYTVGDNVNYTWSCYPVGSMANVYVFLQKTDSTTFSNNYINGTTTASSTHTGVINTSNLIPGSYLLKACLSTSCTTSESITTSQNFKLVLPSDNSSGINPIVVNAPTGLNIYGGATLTSSFNYIPLVWTDNSINEDRFSLEKKLTGTTTWTKIITPTGQNLLSFSDHNVTAGVHYDYRVQACLGDVCSSYSNFENVYIPTIISVLDPNLLYPSLDETPIIYKATPPSPTELKKDSAYSVDALSYIIIRWAYNFDNDVQFIIKRKLNNIATSVYSKIGTTQKGINYFKDLTVKPAVPYDYSVSACDSTGSCSNPVEVKGIFSPSPILTPPNAPSGLTKEINYFSTYSPTVTIRWKDNSTNEDKFIIERRTNLNTTYAQLGEIIPSNITSYVDKIEAGIYYEYRIKACSVNSCSIYSNLLDKVYVPKPQVAIDQSKEILYTDKIIEEPLKLPGATTTVLQKPGISNTEIKTENITETQTTTSSLNEIKVPLSSVNISEVLNVISGADKKQIEEFKEEKSLIYKDTNGDGISDYDSKYIYNMNPEEPSLVSLYEGKNINASDKILLGFDPTKSELIKITKEEPLVSKAKVVSTYKVKEISLNDKKQIFIKGQALPNSFITIYVYSTPIIVTIKTDSRGEWQYLLDKELENGDHTVYTATVNNTGNIVAQSSPFSFTKTAEAVTLNDFPITEASSTDKPGLMNWKNIYIIVIALVMAIGITLILVGLFTKKEPEVMN